jgi:hypothetical protein
MKHVCGSARGKLLSETIEILKKIFGDVSRLERCLQGIYFCVTKVPQDETCDYFRTQLDLQCKALKINMAACLDNVFIFDPLKKNPSEGFDREQVCTVLATTGS